ncbi:MAG: 5-(carboxyamino)imidazole ribonucleotide synthase [Vampirovibrionales bacterium]|nr:5-(carboxyamino)imidazole ribonucleotide synthase [Vampirovibrionales bacterium]
MRASSPQTVGILGAGQLGMMLAEAAHALGLRALTFAPEDDAPADRVANGRIRAGYDDNEALARFAAQIDVATLEFENIPVSALTRLAAQKLVFPGQQALFVAQHRLREKTFLAGHGFPLTPFLPVGAPDELPCAFATLGGDACILKTAAFGYDGKGQYPVSDAAQAEALMRSLSQATCVDRGPWVLERRVDFMAECSMIAARRVIPGQDACDITHFGLIENHHRAGILDWSMSPALSLADLEETAAKLTGDLMAALDYTGILCVELFVTRDRRLLINEIAPRVHNSGHLTREGFVDSQFACHLQAGCGLAFGPVVRRAPAAAMVNLLGDLWFAGANAAPQEPDWTALKAFPDAALTLYGKPEARSGRKMGHLVVTGEHPHACVAQALAAREALTATAATAASQSRCP